MHNLTALDVVENVVARAPQVVARTMRQVLNDRAKYYFCGMNEGDPRAQWMLQMSMGTLHFFVHRTTEANSRLILDIRLYKNGTCSAAVKWSDVGQPFHRGHTSFDWQGDPLDLNAIHDPSPEGFVDLLNKVFSNAVLQTRQIMREDQATFDRLGITKFVKAWKAY